MITFVIFLFIHCYIFTDLQYIALAAQRTPCGDKQQNKSRRKSVIQRTESEEVLCNVFGWHLCGVVTSMSCYKSVGPGLVPAWTVCTYLVQMLIFPLELVNKLVPEKT